MSLLLQKKKLLHHLRRKCFLLRWCWVRVFLCSQKVLGETHNWPGTPCREMLPVLVPTWINNYLHESWRGIVCFIFVFYLHVGVTTLTNVQADTYTDSLTYIHNHRKGFLNALMCLNSAVKADIRQSGWLSQATINHSMFSRPCIRHRFVLAQFITAQLQQVTLVIQ